MTEQNGSIANPTNLQQYTTENSNQTKIEVLFQGPILVAPYGAGDQLVLKHSDDSNAQSTGGTRSLLQRTPGQLRHELELLERRREDARRISSYSFETTGKMTLV